MNTRGELPDGEPYAKVEENVVNKLKVCACLLSPARLECYLTLFSVSLGIDDDMNDDD